MLALGCWLSRKSFHKFGSLSCLLCSCLHAGEKRGRKERLAELLDFADEHLINSKDLAQQHAPNRSTEGLHSQQYWVAAIASVFGLVAYTCTHFGQPLAAHLFLLYAYCSTWFHHMQTASCSTFVSALCILQHVVPPHADSLLQHICVCSMHTAARGSTTKHQVYQPNDCDIPTCLSGACLDWHSCLPSICYVLSMLHAICR